MEAGTSRIGVVMQRPWQQQDAEFCYHFVVDIILKWQNSEFELSFCTPSVPLLTNFPHHLCTTKVQFFAAGGFSYY